MKKGLFSCLLITLMAFAQAADLNGVWQTVDDKTGYVRAHVRISQAADGSYTGTIIKDFPAPGEPPLTQCKNCPAPFTNKPIIGLNILQNFKADPAQPNHFIDGMVLDPRAGKIYHGKARLNANGNKLTLRGYIGISLIGRSQTWIRQK